MLPSGRRLTYREDSSGALTTTRATDRAGARAQAWVRLTPNDVRTVEAVRLEEIGTQPCAQEA